jgi:hypothetical protein
VTAAPMPINRRYADSLRPAPPLVGQPRCPTWTGCSGSVIRSVALLPGRYVVNFPPPSAWNARASLGITRSNQYPNFRASGYVAINRLSRNGETPIPVELLPQQNRNFSRARPFIKPRLEVRKEQEDQEHDGIPLEGNFPLLPGLPQRIYSDPSRLTSLIRAASAADLCVLHRRIKGMPLCQTRGKTGLPTLETDQDRERYRVKVAFRSRSVSMRRNASRGADWAD